MHERIHTKTYKAMQKKVFSDVWLSAVSLSFKANNKSMKDAPRKTYTRRIKAKLRKFTEYNALFNNSNYGCLFSQGSLRASQLASMLITSFFEPQQLNFWCLPGLWDSSPIICNSPLCYCGMCWHFSVGATALQFMATKQHKIIGTWIW